VEVAIAVFNDSAYLRQALESLCAQTFRDFHVTLLDDGSTDDSLTVATSFESRLPMRIVPAEHRGRQEATAALAELSLDCAPYVLFLDSDIVLPADTIGRLISALESDETTGAVSARCRAYDQRWLGGGQAFLDDLFYESRKDSNGQAWWIYGGAVLYRSQILKGLQRRMDVTEDDDILAKLGGQWRFPAPPELVATHYGVPTKLLGLLRRGEREGVRVCALLRVYPEQRNLANVVRLAPLPLGVLLIGGACAFQPHLVLLAGSLLFGYLAAFLIASRRVRASRSNRLAGALLFTFMNVGFGYGYLREKLRGNTSKLREPARAR
jgi:glycosyltransferase involved in cell wall biosynthesis